MPDQTPDRVAVVAVHGVGNHEPGASARGMADLLLGLNAYTHPNAGSPYSLFTGEEIDVPLPGPEVFAGPPPVKKSLWTKLRTTLEERRGFFENKYRWKNWRAERKKEIDEADISDEFMVTQISGYEGSALCGKYESSRLEGERSGTAGEPVQVHIYEMYWADLAKKNNSVVRFFLSFYQLLIHLSSLGRTAIDHVSLEHVGSRPWLFLQRSYNYATRVLTLGIFNLLVLLPIVAFSPITWRLQGSSAEKTAAIIFALAPALIAAGGALSARRWFGTKYGLFFLFVSGALCLVGYLSWLLAFKIFAACSSGPAVVLALAWWLVAYIVAAWIFKGYDIVRSGALELGLVTMAVVAGLFLCRLCQLVRADGLTEFSYSAAALQVVQYIFLGLRVLWASLILLALLAFLLEFICVRITESPAERARARAAFRTGRFCLAIPTVLLILLTLFAWSGVFHYTWKHVPLYHTEKAIPEAPLRGPLYYLAIHTDEIPALLEIDQRAVNPQSEAGQKSSLSPCTAPDESEGTQKNCQIFEATLYQGAPIGLLAVLLSLGIATLLLLLLAGPSARQEMVHPLKAANGKSRWLGEWLSGAFSSFRVAIAFFWLAAFGVPLFCIVAGTICYFRGPHLHSYMYTLYTWAGHEWTLELVRRSGPIVASAMVLLVTAGKPIFKSLSTVLDTVLDVDNYLRTSPAKNTPRAEVVERYAALLRFLYTYRGADGRGYDRIVIVAHSLGSLISADVLRFLNRNRIPGLTLYAYAGKAPGSIPMRLFTMGSPLRQLLNRFFPNLYLYIRPVPDDSGEDPSVEVPAPPAGIPEQASPRPAELALQTWVNNYRSGDYVGRSVWLDDWMKRTTGNDNLGAFPNPVQAERSTDPSGERVEACIGLGAHTHYWDRTAPDVAEQLDELVTQK